MAVELKSAICTSDADREIRAEDFHPWSYNLHYLTASEPWTYRHHRHFGCFELVYTLSGTVEHRLNDSWRRFSPGDLLAVGEEDFHALRGENFAYANLIIPVSFWGDFVSAMSVGDPLHGGRTCHGRTVQVPRDKREEFQDQMDRLFRLQQTPEGERHIRRFLAILLSDVYWDVLPAAPGGTGGNGNSREPEPESPGAPAWWFSLVEAVEEGGDIPADPVELARLAGRSREHVSRTCRRMKGCSPSTWLNRLRLERAALLLRKTNRDIADIIFSLDFGNLHHFYRLFRERYGMPPGAFRTAYGDAP